MLVTQAWKLGIRFFSKPHSLFTLTLSEGIREIHWSFSNFLEHIL